MKTIKYLRMAAKLRQSALAELMGTTQPALSAWENGRGTMPEARRRVALAALQERLGGLYPRLELADLDEPWDAVSRRW